MGGHGESVWFGPGVEPRLRLICRHHGVHETVVSISKTTMQCKRQTDTIYGVLECQIPCSSARVFKRPISNRVKNIRLLQSRLTDGFHLFFRMTLVTLDLRKLYVLHSPVEKNSSSCSSRTSILRRFFVKCKHFFFL
jgi:hypothetical protein